MQCFCSVRFFVLCFFIVLCSVFLFSVFVCFFLFSVVVFLLSCINGISVLLFVVVLFFIFKTQRRKKM